MRSVMLRRATTITAVLGLTLTAAPTVAQAGTRSAPFTNAPVLVTVTVQGLDGPLFKKKVITWGHDVTPATGSRQKYDGTNGGAHSSRVPTPTAALDHAAAWNGFTWDGTWYEGFDDYFVDSVKNVDGNGPAYWMISVNGGLIPVGGCQFRIKNGDRVAFTLTTF
ncbi:DUF4430 domain-containing protein [Streptomyces sp. NPDC055607]